MVLLATVACSKMKEETVEQSNYPLTSTLFRKPIGKWPMKFLYFINEHRASMAFLHCKRDRQYASAHAVDHTQYMIEKTKLANDNFGARPP